MVVKLSFPESRARSGSGDMILHQNRPNPYQHETIIEFELPKTDVITLRVMDVSGRVLVSQTAEYSKGLNQWKPE